MNIVAPIVCIAGVIASGCTHTYVYGTDAPPPMDRGELVVPSRTGDERYTIRQLAVATRDEPFAFRSPTSAEVDALRAGVVPESIDSVRVEVDNSGEMWRDYGLAGFGIGASVVLATFSAVGLIDPGVGGGGLTLPLVFLIASALGTEFMLFGLGFGVALESGQTDMRYRTSGQD